MAKKLGDIGFKSSVADRYIWIGPATKPEGSQYSEYSMMYKYEILEIYTNATTILNSL